MGELDIYGVIDREVFWGDETTPTNFKTDLDKLGQIKTLNIYINSPGGDVYAGQTIHSIISRLECNVVCHIDGLAASIASLIAMAGNKVIMYSGSMMMIHKPWSRVTGDANKMQAEAARLDKIEDSTIVAAYKSRTNLSEDQIKEMLTAETWLSAKECVEKGFADEIMEGKSVSACVDSELMQNYEHVPEAYAALMKTPSIPEPEIINNYDVQNKLRLLELYELDN